MLTSEGFACTHLGDRHVYVRARPALEKSGGKSKGSKASTMQYRRLTEKKLPCPRLSISSDHSPSEDGNLAIVTFNTAKDHGKVNFKSTSDAFKMGLLFLKAQRKEPLFLLFVTHYENLKRICIELKSNF